MPNGYDYSKKYGPHKYKGKDGTSNCCYGCGCSAGPSMSHGPAGLNPIEGECPGNPIDGRKVGNEADYEIVVERRIRSLESRAFEAENLLKRVSPKKKYLAEELEKTREAQLQTRQLLEELQKKINESLKG